MELQLLAFHWLSFGFCPFGFPSEFQPDVLFLQDSSFLSSKNGRPEEGHTLEMQDGGPVVPRSLIRSCWARIALPATRTETAGGSGGLFGGAGRSPGEAVNLLIYNYHFLAPLESST